MLLAAGANPATAHLTELCVVLGAAVVAGWLLRLVGAPAIIGFMAAGMAIGPSSLGWVRAESVAFVAELGLVLLLFTVGLELSPGPLMAAGRGLLKAAGVQIVATALLAAGGVLLWGGQGGGAAAIIGLGVSLSSTAIVLKLLSDRGEVESPAGVITTGILLIQDVVVIAVMVALPLLAGASAGGGWGRVALKLSLALLALAAVTGIAWMALPHILNQLFRRGRRELMTLFAVFMAVAGAWLASLADWSWPLGACVAGLLLATTDLRHQLMAEVAPFRDVLNALFFVSIGMLVDLELVRANGGTLALLVTLVLTGKLLVTTAATRLAGWPLRLALQTALGLCTVSEFAYVLVIEAERLDMLGGQTTRWVIALIVGTMFVGAILSFAAGPIAMRLDVLLGRRAVEPGAPPAAEAADAHGIGPHHVIVVGYGVNGQNLTRVLRGVGLDRIVIEGNRELARQARAGGERVIVGDATREAILDHARIDTARVLVVSIADRAAAERIVAQAARRRPQLTIVARTRFVADVERLRRLGARIVIPEEFETSIEIFAHVLKEFAIPDNIIEQQVALVRADSYGMLRGRPTDRATRERWLQALAAAATQTYLVEPGSPAAGRTLAQLDLRARTGVTVVALTRAGRPIASPGPGLAIETGDVLVLVGSHAGLERVRGHLGPAPTSDLSERD